MVTLQENETMKRLAAYAALVAVPTMIAGIYGCSIDCGKPSGYDTRVEQLTASRHSAIVELAHTLGSAARAAFTNVAF
jgi:hypothetical protein